MVVWDEREERRKKECNVLTENEFLWKTSRVRIGASEIERERKRVNDAIFQVFSEI
jgi:hypothetical protein